MDRTSDQALARMFAGYAPRHAHEPRPSPPEDLVVEPASTGDIPAIAALYAQRESVPLAAAIERITRRLAEPPEKQLFLAGHIHDQLVGYARAAWIDTPREPQFAAVPQGWYLMGVIVHPSWRRRGIAAALTRRRLDWIGNRASQAFYFVNSLNRASIDLHLRFGFQMLSMDFLFPGATFSGGGCGMLFRVECAPPNAEA